MGADAVSFVDHPLLEPDVVQRRLYQLQLAGTAKDHHTLVCLPTGLGKTTVSLLVTAQRLDEFGGKALFLAPTKPLVNQHAEFYREALSIPDDEIVVFTGEVSPDDRAALWEDATVVIATPQVVENDLVGSRIDLADVVHVTFDECHRATGEYAYVYIAERYHADAEHPLVTGMSASPGGDESEILQVCQNLGLTDVEVMTEEDADVAKYTYDTDVEWFRVDLPDEIVKIRDALNDLLKERLESLKSMGVIDSASLDISQRDLNRVRGRLQRLIEEDDSAGYNGMSIHAEVMKLRRAVTLAETQGVQSLRAYFERLENQARSSGASKASQRLVSEVKFKTATLLAEDFEGLHPKFAETRRLVIETLVDDGERVIVFTESRDTVEQLTAFLSNHVDARRFVGQGSTEGSDGMTQNQQAAVLSAFRDGEFDVLVSTSVAEEGLDVPEVDLVLFYEPVPTAIRSIQRKGRTGRQTEGRVIVLIARDTRDEAFFWISRRREKAMHEELRSLKRVASSVEAELDDDQRDLGVFGGSDEGWSETPSAANGGDDPEPPREEQQDLGAFVAKTAAGETAAESDTGADDGIDGAERDADDAADSDTNERDADEATSDTDEPDGDAVVAAAGGDGDGVEIVADQRELDATIARDLSKRDGVDIRLETLQVGDYVLSDRVVVERKTVADFLDTLTGGDRSLFEQAGAMTRHYERPIVIVEGDGLYEERNVHPNAIRGALASLVVDYGVSVLWTSDERETADLLEVIAGREQTDRDREVRVHGEKTAKTLTEQQEYVVSSIATIGPVTARALLAAFGSVEAVLTATEDELLEVSGIGAVTADRIRSVAASAYDPS